VAATFTPYQIFEVVKFGTGFRLRKGDFNYREYLERQNIFAVINTKENNITLLSHNYRSNPILKYTYLIREKLKNQILEKMPLESGAFLSAILLGDRSELPKHLQTAFKNCGVYHIMAISGLHVGLVAAALLYLFRFFRMKREAAYILTILFIVFFAMLALSRPSVVRATVMVVLFFIGRLLGKKIDISNSVAMAALFILIRNPHDVFNVGFQLSFVAVLSIIFLAPLFLNLIKTEKNFIINRFFLAPFAVSLAAWIGTSPLIVYYFKIVTPVAVIANLLIIPALFVSLISGLVFLLFGWMDFAAGVLVSANNLCCNVIFALADFFAGLKFGHFYI
ncbi:MAG: ComEC/Rec2 family competence protein, partial [Candidatus Omnitrophica bacterium]|nr:ComEC/Rec2 family competence protein [Candidatus Omnitrophota bacterium]